MDERTGKGRSFIDLDHNYVKGVRPYPLLDGISTSSFVWFMLVFLDQSKKKMRKGVANGKKGKNPKVNGNSQAAASASSTYSSIVDDMGAYQESEDEEVEEDDRPCHVCFSEDPYDLSETMILCDLCNGPYHLRCVGLTPDKVPEGSYLCTWCLSDKGPGDGEQEGENE